MQLRPRSSGSAPPLEGEIHAVACEGFALGPVARLRLWSERSMRLRLRLSSQRRSRMGGRSLHESLPPLAEGVPATKEPGRVGGSHQLKLNEWR